MGEARSKTPPSSLSRVFATICSIVTPPARVALVWIVEEGLVWREEGQTYEEDNIDLDCMFQTNQVKKRSKGIAKLYTYLERDVS